MNLLSPETLTMLHQTSTLVHISAKHLEAIAIASFTDGLRYAVEDARERHETPKKAANQP
jgi:hypothetical protein